MIRSQCDNDLQKCATYFVSIRVLLGIASSALHETPINRHDFPPEQHLGVLDYELHLSSEISSHKDTLCYNIIGELTEWQAHLRQLEGNKSETFGINILYQY